MSNHNQGNGHAVPIIQNCWVVADVDVAISNWVAIGVGPFFKFDTHFPDAIHRGRIEPLATTVALAQAGDVQIELIAQRSTGPSAFRDSIAAGENGFHHVCREFGDYEEAIARFKRQGFQVAGELSASGARCAYVDTRRAIGCMIEIVDDPDGLNAQLFKMVREAAVGWDGRDPVRMLAALGEGA